VASVLPVSSTIISSTCARALARQRAMQRSSLRAISTRAMALRMARDCPRIESQRIASDARIKGRLAVLFPRSAA
jgi:hypothetical protein